MGRQPEETQKSLESITRIASVLSDLERLATWKHVDVLQTADVKVAKDLLEAVAITAVKGLAVTGKAGAKRNGQSVSGRDAGLRMRRSV